MFVRRAHTGHSQRYMPKAGQYSVEPNSLIEFAEIQSVEQLHLRPAMLPVDWI